MGLLASSGQQTRLNTPDHADEGEGSPLGYAGDQDVELVRLRAELRVQQAEARAQQLEVELVAAREQVRDLKGQVHQARMDLEDWRGRHDAAEAEMKALRQAGWDMIHRT